MMATNPIAAEQAAGTTVLRRGTLSELAQRLERLKATTKDVVADTRDVRLVRRDPPGDDPIVLDVPKLDWLPLTRHAHTQLAEKVGIPQRFYDRLQRDHPSLLVDNVNGLIGDGPERRLFRAADGHVRAILSDRYRVLDSYDLALKLAERAVQHNAQIETCTLTEQRMAIKVVVPGAREKVGELTAELRAQHARQAAKHLVNRGSVMDLDADYVVPGVMVSNSEVGAGAFKVEPFAMRLVCWNGAISEASLYKVHIGGRLESGEVVYSDHTRELSDQALWAQVSDVIDATFNPDAFRAMIGRMRDSKSVEIAKPVQVTDAVAKNLALPLIKKEALLRYFSVDGFTAFGLANGITRLAQDEESPDAQTELERYAGRIFAEPDQVLALA